MAIGILIGAVALAAYGLGVFLLAAAGVWLPFWHGEGEAHQYQFYRCHGCRRLVTYHIIRSGGCPCHESAKVSPTHLSLGAKFRLLYLPWSVTSFTAKRESLRRTRMAKERELLEGMVK